MTFSWKSLLFVPGNNPSRIGKAAALTVDAVIIDLEDAVAAEQKAEARAQLTDAIATVTAAGRPVVVRINSRWSDVIADLAVAVQEGVAAIMVPKVQHSARLAVLGEMIAEMAEERNLPRRPAMIVLIEDPEGLAQIDSLAAVDGVIGLALGTEDFSLALGVPPSGESLVLPCRQIALAAARRGIMALGLPVSIATIEDRDAWSSAARQARAMGMSGALCIHPAQVESVNQVFSPSAEEIAFARGALEAWDAAGGAGVIRHAGRMIDLPVVLAAQRLLGSSS